MNMGLIELVLLIAILGFCAWLLLTYIPMAAAAKNIIVALIVMFAVVMILQKLGFVTGHSVHL